jgi:fatty-acyl-CoA synthase
VDRGEGEGLVLLVERARGATDARNGRDAALVAAIGRAVLARTGVRPDEVVLLAPGALPRTSSGKLRRHEALRRWLAGRLDPPRRANAVSLARQVARSALAYARVRLQD